jgi:GC-rich sequence DNA-binding factor
MVSKRRRQDNEDDLSLFLGSPPLPPAEPVETDELGRTAPSANPSVLRHSRRAERTARHAKHSRASSDAEEGYSTDASLAPSDAADYVDALSSLSTRAKEITADVRAAEFRNPRAGLAKWFGEWRSRHGDVYTGAWGGLGLVAAWEFWVRLEIVGWNPLVDRKSLDEFGWYVGLYEYSRPVTEGEEGEGGERELGPDGDLVSAMVATAVVPRVCKMLEGGALDAYSAGDVRRLVDLAEQLEMSVERSHLKFQVGALHPRFTSSVAHRGWRLDVSQSRCHALPCGRRRTGANHCAVHSSQPAALRPGGDPRT